ncbi:hypothetical protein, partial [Paenibacillus roseus]|uniref:hypothetical protein n=2 Tax=Paenibacillus TaxID=44249 RepID=UPI001E593B0E
MSILQKEKTLDFLENYDYVFFIQWTPQDKEIWSSFKKKCYAVDTISLLTTKNSVFLNMEIDSLPQIEGPNIFLGCNDYTKLNLIFNIIKSTPNLILIGTRINSYLYNHLDLNTYFQS